MQFLKDHDLIESLKEIKMKAAPEDFRKRVLNESSTPKAYPWLAATAILLLTFTIFTLTMKDQDAPAELTKRPGTSQESRADPGNYRYISPQEKNLVYIDDQPYHQVNYIIVDREDVEIDGSMMQIITPREEQHLVPAAIF